MIVALAGGVGGAKLALGLAALLAPSDLTLLVNTGDDFEHLGLQISPDLDTVIYTLAGVNDVERGWGRAGETWNFMQALSALGGEDWFSLGDRDLATHIERTRLLRAGERLTAVTERLSQRLGVRQRILPMSDDPVRTVVRTESGALAFQRYFVERRCEPRVFGFEFAGAERALPSPEIEALMRSQPVKGVVICPSNPFVSIGPILAIERIRSWLDHRNFPIVAVSPIVAGAAIKGPAAKMFSELGGRPSAASVALHYGDLVDTWIIDERDRSLAADIETLGTRVHVTQTVMSSDATRRALAQAVINSF